MMTACWCLAFACLAVVAYLVRKNWSSIIKWLQGIFKKHIHAVDSFTFIQAGGYMEKFKGTWTPSPDSFVEKHNLVYQFAGAGEVVGPDLPSSTVEAFVTFADADAGKSGQAWVRTTGDNGTVADCAKVNFSVTNAAQVRPVENFGFAWDSHVV